MIQAEGLSKRYGRRSAVRGLSFAFVPHLTGAANLRLLWRAAGRE